MLKKWLIVFAFARLSIASAKTYGITLLAPTKVGNAQLQPGDYRVKLDGSKAIFTDTVTRKVDTTAAGGSEHLNAIELQGTTTKLDFN